MGEWDFTAGSGQYLFLEIREGGIQSSCAGGLFVEVMMLEYRSGVDEVSITSPAINMYRSISLINARTLSFIVLMMSSRPQTTPLDWRTILTIIGWLNSVCERLHLWK